MRTTVRLDEALLRQAKQHAARTGRTLTSIIDESLRQFLSAGRRRPGNRDFRLTPFRGSGVTPGVDLDDSAALREVMEQRRPLDKRR